MKKKFPELMKTNRHTEKVMHAAGVLDDAIVAALTPERLDAVLRAQGRRRLATCTS